MIHKGMPTLIETPALEDCAMLCRSLGLDFIELNMNLPQFQIDAMDPVRFQRIAEQYGIYYTIHLDENLNVSDFNPHIAQGYLRTVTETIRFAQRLHIPVLNMHLPKGVYFTLPDRKVYLFEEYRSRYLTSIRTFRDACERAVGSAPIRLCVENCDGFLPFQKEAVKLLLDSPVFGLTFDIGHDHGIGGADEPFILQYRDRLCHMHIHDARGKRNHLPLGEGDIVLSQYLALAEQQQCRIVLETKTVAGLKQSVQWLHHNTPTK